MTGSDMPSGEPAYADVYVAGRTRRVSRMDRPEFRAEARGFMFAGALGHNPAGTSACPVGMKAG